jgi:branched-chain amino acid transport system permease protein
LHEVTEFLGALISGILGATPLFLVASGLTIVYGTLGVINFAQGALFMVGGFLMFQLLSGQTVSVWEFFGAVLACGLLVGIFTMVIERLVFRRLYFKPHIMGLLASFGLLFLAEGLCQQIWGLDDLTQNTPSGLTGFVSVHGVAISDYMLVDAAVAGVFAALLWLMLQKSGTGRKLRAVADDRTMADAVGIRSDRIGILAWGVSGLMAGIAGALLAPLSAIDINLAQTYLILSFAVIILGGIGSVKGALVASIGLGLLTSFLAAYASGFLGYGVYIGLAAGMLIRRQEMLVAR